MRFMIFTMNSIIAIVGLLWTESHCDTGIAGIGGSMGYTTFHLNDEFCI